MACPARTSTVPDSLSTRSRPRSRPTAPRPNGVRFIHPMEIQLQYSRAMLHHDGLAATLFRFFQPVADNRKLRPDHLILNRLSPAGPQTESASISVNRKAPERRSTRSTLPRTALPKSKQLPSYRRASISTVPEQRSDLLDKLPTFPRTCLLLQFRISRRFKSPV